MSDGNDVILELQNTIKEILESLCEECQEEGGVIRGMAEHFGVNDSAIIVEAAIEAMDNGEDYPYPVVHFNFTMAKEIEPEHFGKIAELLNDLNVVFQTGDFPSFGNFCLYKPYGQVFYGYKMPINIGALEGEQENIKFFFATVFDQLDLFVDLVLYVAQGDVELTLEDYLAYLKGLKDLYDLQERADKLEEMLRELESKQ